MIGPEKKFLNLKRDIAEVPELVGKFLVRV